jgi:hypothetical protein
MTLADSTLNQLALAESLSSTRRAESAKIVKPDISAPSCSFHLSKLVKTIQTPQVREIVETVFQDLLRLLDCLHPIESQLDRLDEAEEALSLFQAIHDEASALVKFIREEALTCEELDQELYDTLDGITFAVSHDLQRVFETKVPGTPEENTSRAVAGKLFRAHDVLTNCLQQATIILATTFDSGLIGTELFSNWELRYRQSIQLCRDLSTLLKLIEACSEKQGKRAFANLTAGLEKFRIESKQCLRYSDCPQFESFCERIQLAATPAELEPVLHQFRCYLETLLGQVRMRAVLSNVFPIEFGAHDSAQSPSPHQHTLSQSYLPADLQDDRIDLDSLLIAV